MNIGKQLDSLLKRHSSIFVKGLGVFTRVYTPSTYDDRNNVLLPPISFIEFDIFGSEGFDFITYIQQVQHIDRDQAELYLANKVSQILEDLDQHGESTLDCLGTLVTYGNSFVFKPLDLSGFVYHAVEHIPADLTTTVAEEDNDNSWEENSVTLPEPTPIVTDQEQGASEVVESTNEDLVPSESLAETSKNDLEVDVKQEAILPVEDTMKENKDSNSYIYGLIAAVALIILGGIYYYLTVYTNNTPIATVPVLTDTLPVDTLSSKVDSIINQDSLIVDSLVKDKLKDTINNSIPKTEDKIVNKEKSKNYKYTIVIGTHLTLTQAQAEADSYVKKGHKTVRVLEPNLSKNLKRVVWDTYPTREKRDSALREVRKHYQKDAWGTEI